MTAEAHELGCACAAAGGAKADRLSISPYLLRPLRTLAQAQAEFDRKNRQLFGALSK
jgi:hypothetical protein